MKILFYGFRHGHISSLYQHIRSSDNFEIADCVEENAEARSAAETTLGASFSGSSYETSLKMDIDVVAIGKAYGERGAAIIAALEAGKHVIADKPICTRLSELEKIRFLSREKGLSVACMLDLRYLPQSIEAKKILRGGTLGAVRNVSFNGQHYLDYGKRPRWYYEPDAHGGTINDLAIHGIDLVRELTGLEFSGVDAARTWNAYATEEPHFKDCGTFMARLNGGASVLADVSYSAPSQAFTMPSYWEFRFWCDRGMLTFNYISSTVTVYEDGKSEPQLIECSECGDYLAELYTGIISGDRSVTESVLRSTETALEIQASAL